LKRSWPWFVVGWLLAELTGLALLAVATAVIAVIAGPGFYWWPDPGLIIFLAVSEIPVLLWLRRVPIASSASEGEGG
jgi:hypothetical protein